MSKNIKSWISDSYISAKAEAYLQQSANNSSNNKKNGKIIQIATYF